MLLKQKREHHERGEFKMLTITTNTDEEALDVIKILGLYEVMFKVKNGKIRMFTIDTKQNSIGDYRLTEMYFQINYFQHPCSGNDLHFHGKIVR